MNETLPFIVVAIAVLVVIVLVAVLVFRKRSTQLKDEGPAFKTTIEDDWYDSVSRRIEELKNVLNERDFRKLRLYSLLCIARRVAEFSPECGQCMMFREEITLLVKNAQTVAQTNDRKQRKSYSRSVNRYTAHFQKTHNLVNEGYYTAMYMAIGSGIGVAIGAALDNIALGIPIGVGVGVAIGASLDSKAKKENRILCPGEATPASGSVLIISLVLGIVVVAALVVFLLLRSAR